MPISRISIVFGLVRLLRDARRDLGMWASIRKAPGDVPVAGRHAETETSSRMKGTVCKATFA